MNEIAAARLSVDYMVKDPLHVTLFESAAAQYVASCPSEAMADLELKNYDHFTFVKVEKTVEDPSASYAEFEHEADLMEAEITEKARVLGVGAVAASYHSGTMITGLRLPERE